LTSFTDGSGTTTYTWNVRNQLTAISGPGLTASFAYDGLGRRSNKTVNSATTGYWYDGQDILAELSGSTVTASYLRSLAIDEPFIRKGANDEFYEADSLGSTLALTNSSGASQSTYTYEPFGKTSVAGTSTNFLQYAGRENDGTGWHFYRARYYSASLQRFVSEDPLRFESETANFYQYALNDPANLIDPLGLKPPPNIPRDVDICKNIREAETKLSAVAWLNRVWPKGEWDYKRRDIRYEDFGNYNYAVTAVALGVPPWAVRRGAGFAQWWWGPYDPADGKPWDLFPPYSDNPIDQAWINEGVKDYGSGYWKKRCDCRLR